MAAGSLFRRGYKSRIKRDRRGRQGDQGTVLQRPGIRDSRTAGDHRRGNEPHEHLCSAQDYAGLGKLYPLCWQRGTGGGDRLRFQAHVPGICQRSGTLPGGKRHQSVYL